MIEIDSLGLALENRDININGFLTFLTFFEHSENWCKNYKAYTMNS